MNRNHVANVTALQDQDGENNIWEFFILNLSCNKANVENVCPALFILFPTDAFSFFKLAKVPGYTSVCVIAVTSNISIVLSLIVFNLMNGSAKKNCMLKL